MAKRLTNRILEAIIEMSNRVEAGGVADYRGYDRPEDERAYWAALEAGDWARSVVKKREAKKAAQKEPES